MARATPATAPAAPVPNATAFAPQPGIGATASRAIAVKSAPEKPVARKAARHMTPELVKMKAAAAKRTAEKKQLAHKVEVAAKAEPAKKTAPAAKAVAHKKPEPAKAAGKTASKAKEKAQ
jgi:hypothetical protein